MKQKIYNEIGLGTAAIGRPIYMNIRQSEQPPLSLDVFRNKGMELLNAAYDQGVRYFDTAPNYGMAEEMLIDWAVKRNDPNIEIATKWGYTYVANFDPNAKQHEVKEHSLEKLNQQWAKSKNLLPLLTTYQIHSTTFETGVLENEAILNRLAELKNENNLHLGITATGANQTEILKRALATEVNGKELFNVFQVTYNIFDQSTRTVATEIAKHNKRLVIKEALGNGRIFPNEKYPNYVKAYDLLNQLAQKYEVGLDAIALRFCLDSIPVYKVLSGAANQQHLFDNLKVANFKLEEGDLSILRELAVDPILYWNERKQLSWN